MTCIRTYENTDAIRIAVFVGRAVMALIVLLTLAQIFAVISLGHGIVPGQVFSASALLALVVPIMAGLAIERVRKLLNLRFPQVVPAACVAPPLSIISATLAPVLQPPRAAL